MGEKRVAVPTAIVPLLLIGCVVWHIAGAAHARAADLGPSLSERTTLTGDWGGRRAALAARGIEIGLVNYGDAMSVVGGGIERQTDFPGLVEPSLAVDLERLLGWQDVRTFLRGIGTYGSDPAEATGSLNAPSNLADAVDTFKLLEGWLEWGLLDDTVAILVGLYDADTEFDVKETAGVFMNGGFGTGLDLSESGLNGPCIFPTSCVGVRVGYRPTPAYYLQVAVLDGVAGDPDDPHGTQVHLDADDGILVLGEAGYQQGADAGRFTRAALGAWHYTTTFDDLLEVDAQGQPRRRDGTQGVYALLEGELFREPGQPTQGLSGFLRVGMADQDVNPVRYYAGGGVVYTGLLPARGEDVAGFGVSAAFLGDKFKTAQRRAGTPVDDREIALEGTYWMPLLPWMSLQLDAQYIRNPGADPDVDDALVFGLRYQIAF